MMTIIIGSENLVLLISFYFDNEAEVKRKLLLLSI